MKRDSLLFLVLAALVFGLLPSHCWARTIHVPTDKPTIQSAIVAAANSKRSADMPAYVVFVCREIVDQGELNTYWQRVNETLASHKARTAGS